MITFSRIAPKGEREWYLFFLGAAVAVLVLMFLGARYSLIPTGGGTPLAFLLDRWTGDVWRCAGSCTHQ